MNTPTETSKKTFTKTNNFPHPASAEERILFDNIQQRSANSSKKVFLINWRPELW